MWNLNNLQKKPKSYLLVGAHNTLFIQLEYKKLIMLK